MYSLFWYLLTFLMKKITTAENIHPQRREVVVSGNEDCFYRALALWRVKQAMRSIRRSVSTVYSLFWYLLTFLMKKITTAENIHPQRREVVVSGNEDCFYRALALWRVKQAMRSIRRSVSRVPVCFRKIRRISGCHSLLFSTSSTLNFLE